MSLIVSGSHKLLFFTIHPRRNLSNLTSPKQNVASGSSIPAAGSIAAAKAISAATGSSAGSWLTKIRTMRDRAFSPRYLLYTNLAIGMGLAGTADTIQQFINRLLRGVADQHDPRRTVNMMVAAIPTLTIWHHWYIFLDRKLPNPTIRTALAKVLIDAGFMAPICWGIYLVAFWLVDRKRIEAMRGDATAKIGRMYLAEWCIWPPAQTINFYFLPTRYRIAYVSFIALFMDLYWSYLLNDFSTDATSNPAPTEGEQENDSKEINSKRSSQVAVSLQGNVEAMVQSNTKSFNTKHVS